MKERFEDRVLTGAINVKLKDPTTGTERQWVADKGTIVNNIISTVNTYRGKGFRLTLRQLYYQLVKGNIIPNHDTAYKKLGDILDDCRYSGRIDWDSIEDRGRTPKLPYSVEGIADAMNDTARAYRLNRQDGQNTVVELWTEKDAISNILWRVTAEFHVNLVVNKGYTSSSAIYGAYERFVEVLKAGKKIVILYFGDHDPSGLDMIRDIEDRLMTFFSKGNQLIDDTQFHKKIMDWAVGNDYRGGEYGVYEAADAEDITERQFKSLMGEDPSSEAVEAFEAGRTRRYIKDHDLFKVIPIGLTMNQIKQYALPPNPAKITDPRAANYIKKHGRISWEVDALNPDILMQIVRDNIEATIDKAQYKKVLTREKKEKLEIEKIAADYK